MFWTRDRKAFQLVTHDHRQTMARLVEGPERAELPSTGTVNLTAEVVLALFEGTALERAHRRAALTAVQFGIIFGRATEMRRGTAPHYRMARKQRKIGETITHPTVIKALANEPFWVLEVAARESSPELQIRAATQAWIDRLVSSADMEAASRPNGDDV
jgi:hypothetical protein